MYVWLDYIWLWFSLTIGKQNSSSFQRFFFSFNLITSTIRIFRKFIFIHLLKARFILWLRQLICIKMSRTRKVTYRRMSLIDCQKGWFLFQWHFCFLHFFLLMNSTEKWKYLCISVIMICFLQTRHASEAVNPEFVRKCSMAHGSNQDYIYSLYIYIHVCFSARAGIEIFLHIEYGRYCSCSNMRAWMNRTHTFVPVLL